MAVRQIQIHDGETENHHHKIENAEPGSTGAPPGRGACEPKIDDVEHQHEQRDDVFRIVDTNIDR